MSFTQKMQALPHILINTIPKSGTHLMNQIIRGIPFYQNSPWVWVLPTTDYANTLEAIDCSNSTFKSVILGHLLADDNVKKTVHSLQNTKTIFIYRDPRDVLISWMHHIERDGHVNLQYESIFEALSSKKERINACIKGLGFHSTETGVTLLEDIGTLYRMYMPWRDEDHVLSFAFSELVDPLKKDLACHRVLDFLWDDLQAFDIPRGEFIQVMTQSVQPKTSPTFRKGVVGDWKNHFTDENKRIFKEVAGDLLIELGYEGNNDW